MATEPVCFEINVADRYVIVLTVPPEVSLERLARATECLTTKLNEWWDTNKKFTVVGVLPDVTIEVRRLEEGDV